MVFETTGSGLAFLAARVLFGAILAFMGLNNLLQLDQMIPYAEAKGVPLASVAVPFTGGMLVVGGISIVLGAYVVVGAGAVAVFLLVTTPVMHDFWAVPEDEQQTELTQFLKNVTMLGGALAFLALASVQWPYAVNAGLF